MEASNSPQLPSYLKGLSYLLMVFGIAGVVSSIAVLYGTFAFEPAVTDSPSIRTFAIGAGGLIAGCLTTALGIVGRSAFKRPKALATARALAIADVAASVIALLCCNAIGGDLPTSLVVSLIMALCWLAASRQK